MKSRFFYDGIVMVFLFLLLLFVTSLSYADDTAKEVKVFYGVGQKCFYQDIVHVEFYNTDGKRVFYRGVPWFGKGSTVYFMNQAPTIGLITAKTSKESCSFYLNKRMHRLYLVFPLNCEMRRCSEYVRTSWED